MKVFEVRCKPYGENTVHTMIITANEVKSDLLRGIIADGVEIMPGMRVESVTERYTLERMYKFPNGFGNQATQTFQSLQYHNFNPKWEFPKEQPGDTWILLPHTQIEGAALAMKFPQQK